MNDEEGGYITEVVFYVQTPEGFDTQLKVIGIPTVGLTATLKGISKSLLAAGFATSSVAQRNQQAVAVSQAADDANGGERPTCPECSGPMEHKSGRSGPKSKNPGTPWAGWFCLRTADMPQNKRHAPIWED